MMPSEKIAQFSSAPPLKMLKSAATEPRGLVVYLVEEPLVQHRRVDAGGRDLRADAHDDDHDQRENDPRPEFGNFQRVGKSGEHGMWEGIIRSGRRLTTKRQSRACAVEPASHLHDRCPIAKKPERGTAAGF